MVYLSYKDRNHIILFFFKVLNKKENAILILKEVFLYKIDFYS